MNGLYDVFGKEVSLEGMGEEEQRELLKLFITSLLQAFGPMKQKLLLRYLAKGSGYESLELLAACLKQLEQSGKIYAYEGYCSLDQRLFDETSFAGKKENGEINVFEMKKAFSRHMDRLDARQRAMSVFLKFRETLGARAWFLGENPRKPWLIMSIVVQDKVFHVLEIKDYNDLYAGDSSAGPRELENRIVLIREEDEIREIQKHEVPGIKSYALVDEDYQVTLIKP